jgi:poly [ADP-ribose] polymerase
MFGKGVYLADMSSKSALNCHHHQSGNTALLLLCDAELGKPMLELLHSDYDAGQRAQENGSYSTWGKGMTTPLKWKDAGCVHHSLKGASMVGHNPDI